MTRPLRDSMLKEEEGGVIGDHLRNHVHLSNCMHLKYHMHRHSPIMAERMLMRNLAVLQRSRSLRDPSTSPPPWRSPTMERKFGKGGVPCGGRRSNCSEYQREINGWSMSSPRLLSMSRSKVAAAEVAGKVERRERYPSHLGTSLNPKGKEADGSSSCCEKEELQTSSHIRVDGAAQVRKGKRRKFRGAQKKSSVSASNPLATPQGTPTGHGYPMKGMGNHVEVEVGREEDLRNGCGIPWNWSRIHHRGKVFLDMAGRSFSCGRSEAKMGKGECHGLRENSPDAAPELHSCSSNKSNSDALPLLNDPCNSEGVPGDSFSDCDYSGELGIFALNRNDEDSDITSAATRSGNRRSRGSTHSRHRSLTQKYMPRTFRDLVGQNLAVQALSNAISRKKVGLLYVFHGPQGTGKTSCARVFAKALNCQSSEQPKPCGTCTSCVSQHMGKSRNVLEVGSVANLDFGRILDVLENTMLSLSSQYRVFIIDDCNTLTAESWTAISKAIDRAPRRVVFLLISSNADHLPHIIISRCQKFFFPKLKDADIIYKLQFIAGKEGLEVDMDALKLIASRADGSLRDAEMTLDQLSLLGQRIDVSLVQELAGLVSDEKLVNLLDMALSADTVNTVKSLREIMEAGVEPLAFMTQLATIITDILAGSYTFTRERLRRKFFRSPKLSKDDMERLRLALKTLSEAEKQLRMSNDKLTWLTAALLQLAPDHQYMLPNSPADMSLRSSPMLLNSANNTIVAKQGNVPVHERNLADGNLPDRGQTPMIGYMDTEKIWKAVIEKINIKTLKQFIREEGKLLSVSFGAAPTVQVLFSSRANKSKAEKFRGHILQAFESVLSTAVTLEMRCDSWKCTRSEPQVSADLPPSDIGSSQMMGKRESHSNKWLRNGTECLPRRIPKDSTKRGAAPSHGKEKSHTTEGMSIPQQGGKGVGVGTSRVEEASCSHNPINSAHDEDRSRRQSLVKGKVSLAHVIQQVEGCTQRTGWSRRKAISIAEKLEQENLRLEPRSRSSLCRKAKRITRAKLLGFQKRTRKSQSLLKLVSCGRCSCRKTQSPRKKRA